MRAGRPIPALSLTAAERETLQNHVVLQTQTPVAHRIAVPAHKALRVGTLNSILRSVARHKGVDRQALLDSL
jgi:hypothetical protein